MRKLKIFSLLFIALFLAGFDLTRHSIPLDEIHDGGPPKDGIPALDDPPFIEGKAAGYLMPGDRVLGLFMNGEAKAYPLRILNWHELVNDTVGGREVLISYCPLCGTGMAFDARIENERYLFGVSGKLYNSDVLFYDRKTESLWSQIKMEAVTGPKTGARLRWVPLQNTTWHDWVSRHPATKVLSPETGHRRDYSRNPYRGYEEQSRLFFPVGRLDGRLFTKAWVLGVYVNGRAKAYPFDALEKAAGPVRDTVGGQSLVIDYDPRHETAVVKDAGGETVPSVQAYWFAWAAFYPQTELFK